MYLTTGGQCRGLFICPLSVVLKHSNAVIVTVPLSVVLNNSNMV